MDSMGSMDSKCNFIATWNSTKNGGSTYQKQEYLSTDLSVDKDTRYIILMNDKEDSYFVTIIIEKININSISYSFRITEPWGNAYFNIEPNKGRKSVDTALYEANDCQNRYSYDDGGDVDIKHNSDTNMWTITPIDNALIAYYSTSKIPCGSSQLSPRVFTKGGLGSGNDGWTNSAFNLPMHLIEDGYILIKTNAGNYGYFTLYNDYPATVYSGSVRRPCGYANVKRIEGENDFLPYLYICFIITVPTLFMCGMRSIIKCCKRNGGTSRERDQSLMV